MIKISPLNLSAAHTVQQNESQKVQKDVPAQNPQNLNKIPHYKIPAFKGTQKTGVEKITDEQFQDACEYLKERTEELKNGDKKIFAENFDLKKLNGIQKDIEVFEGMKLTEIAVIAEKLHGVLLTRGCKNGCAHCFADAKKHIERMSFEDFEKFTGGYQELNNRLGFNVFDRPVKFTQYHTTFHDSDCADIFLKDKNGKVHDLIELNEMLYKTTKTPVIFDTHGWNVKHPTTVERARKYIEHYSNPENAKILHGFNLSLDPYHELNTRAIEFLESDPDRSKKFREAYTNRTAQVLFDMTPISTTKKFHIFPLCTDECSTKSNHTKEKDFMVLFEEIKTKLREKYEEDLASDDPKFIKSEEDIEKYIDNYEKCIQEKYYDGQYKYRYEIRKANPRGRGENLYNKNDRIKQSFEIIKKEKAHITEGSGSPLSQYKFGALIDVNGKVYLQDDEDVFPMESAFNFENKDKQSSPVGPNYHPNKVVKKEDLH